MKKTPNIQAFPRFDQVKEKDLNIIDEDSAVSEIDTETRRLLDFVF